MNTSKDQVLELISSGKISAAEGDELLTALNAQRSSAWKLLINPFEKLNVPTALGCAVVGATLGIALSRWNVRFDGALDVHLVSNVVPWRQAVIDQVVAWPLAAMILWAIGYLFARQGRLLDFLGYVGTARLPLLVVGFVAGAMNSQLPASATEVGNPPPIALLVLVGATLPALVWSVAMMFQGYKAASGLRGAKCAFSFTFAIIVAELLSKLAFHFIK